MGQGPPVVGKSGLFTRRPCPSAAGHRVPEPDLLCHPHLDLHNPGLQREVGSGQAPRPVDSQPRTHPPTPHPRPLPPGELPAVLGLPGSGPLHTLPRLGRLGQTLSTSARFSGSSPHLTSCHLPGVSGSPRTTCIKTCSQSPPPEPGDNLERGDQTPSRILSGTKEKYFLSTCLCSAWAFRTLCLHFSCTDSKKS